MFAVIIYVYCWLLMQSIMTAKTIWKKINQQHNGFFPTYSKMKTGNKHNDHIGWITTENIIKKIVAKSV